MHGGIIVIEIEGLLSCRYDKLVTLFESYKRKCIIY